MVMPTRLAALVHALAYSWTIERLHPSPEVVEALLAEHVAAADAVPAEVRAPFPDWVAPQWRCTANRGVDLEFAAAVRGVLRLMQTTTVAFTQPSTTALALHSALFGDVWEEAGRYRTTDLNIGVHWTQVPVAMRNLDDDWAVWRSEDPHVAAARLHWRYESIHPFPDGNGRSGRLLSDLFLLSVGASNGCWGAGRLNGRERYLAALIAATNGAESLLTDIIAR